jgi:predicted ester cyclase
MSSESNKQLITTYFETIWNEGRFDQEPRFVDENVVVHAPPIPGIPDGIGGPLAIVGTFRASLPDIHLVNDDLIAENDTVVQRWTARGTHTGLPLFGAPPSGNTLVMTGINEFRLADGRIVERWGVMDAAGLMRQLGLVPA